MHSIPKFTPTVKVRAPDYTVYAYRSLGEAIRLNGLFWLQTNVSNTWTHSACRECVYRARVHRGHYCAPHYCVPSPGMHVMWDSTGALFDEMEIPREFAAKYKSSWLSRRQFADRHYKFRSGPVPYTGRGSYGRSFRSMKTTQSRRMAVQVDLDEPKVRAKRNKHNLPDSWDDVYRHRERGWKSQGKRRHQWRE